MLLSIKTFSSIKSQGDFSLPQKTISLVHLLLGHLNIAEKLQFAAKHLKQIEGLTTFEVSFAIFAQESFYCCCSALGHVLCFSKKMIYHCLKKIKNLCYYS